MGKEDRKGKRKSIKLNYKSTKTISDNISFDSAKLNQKIKKSGICTESSWSHIPKKSLIM